MFNQPLPLPCSPLKFLQPRDTDQPITDCRRLRRSRENFWENPARNFLNGWIESAKLTSRMWLWPARGGGFWVAPLRPSYSPYTPPLTPHIQRRTNLADSHCLNLKWPDWRPMATAGGGKGGGTTSGWNNRKRKYLNIRHALKTHCIGQWYQPRYIYNRIGFQIHQRTTCGESSSWSGSWRWAITGDKSWSAGQWASERKWTLENARWRKVSRGRTMGSGASTTASCLFVFPSLNAALLCERQFCWILAEFGSKRLPPT